MASLYNRLTRYQVYLEGVKHWKSQDYGQTLDVLRNRISTLVLNSTDGGIGDMSAAEYRRFERRVRDQLDRTLSRSKQVFMQDLRSMSDVNNKVLRSIYSDRFTRRKLPTDGQIWSSAMRKVMGATGTSVEDFVGNYYASVRRSVLQELRKARTDNLTARELNTVFRGTRDAGFRDGLLNKYRNQANTVIATSLQHISAVASSRYSSIFAERYRWVSVIDAVTTHICRSRNGKIYIYGRGPLPPAHHGCRSTTVPVDNNDKSNYPDNYFEWLQMQPVEVLADIVGTEKAAAIKSGKARKMDYPKFTEIQRIPIDKFEEKLKFILAD